MASKNNIIFLLFAAIILISCKKESFITNSQARLDVSADSLKFDTVFTSSGSIVKSFKIFNSNDQKLLLSQVKLGGGSASAFKINIDGTSATEVNNIEVAANDSLYVFVQVNVDPSTANLPFILMDSIVISYNGNTRFVQLQAYGQNANFLRNIKISGNVVWTNDLPYVILGGLQIDTTAILTIQPGCRIYSHADAPFLVDGTLIVAGTKEENVTFAGDRLDADYKDLPASWPGIYLRVSSKDNNFKFVTIKNAFQALVVQELSTNANPKLQLSQSIIDNSYDIGILGINTNIYADNCLISNCGSNILLGYGGDYKFTHCTVAGYSNLYLNHVNPVLLVSNFITQNDQTFVADLTAAFINCIFWGEGGTVKDEVVVNKEGNTVFNVTFDHVLYKAEKDPENVTNFINVIKNQDPLFDTINISKKLFDFHFNNNPSSPAIDSGKDAFFSKDLDDNPRLIGLAPDLGCYERQ